MKSLEKIMMNRLSLPEPMRVSETMISRCRVEIERWPKRLARSALVPILKSYFGFQELGEGFHWGLPLNIRRGQIRVGRYSYIGANASINSPLVIGDLCMLSTNIQFVGNDHRIDVVGGPIRLEFAETPGTTIIEADCWIGHGAIIRAGIRIGRGAVVGAGSVVTKSILPYEIVAGAPARCLRMRFDTEGRNQHDQLLYGRNFLE